MTTRTPSHAPRAPAARGTARVTGEVLRAAQAKAMTEAELEENVRDVCATLRVVRVHQYRSVGTEPGWPDDVLIGTGVLFRELKRVGKSPTRAQEAMHAALRAAGQDVAVWTPTEWFDGTILRQVTAISPRR